MSSPASGATYQPIDTLKPVADDVWTVDSGPMYGALPLRMTVVRLPGGGLLLHSPTRYTSALAKQLEALGPVRALFAPNFAHWVHLRDWQLGCPGVATWAAPGLRNRRPVRKAGVVVDHDLTGTPPPEWGGVIALVTVPGGLGFKEVALFHVPSRTLVLADLVQNLEERRLPALLRPLARLAGNLAPNGRAPAHLRLLVRLNGGARRAAEQLVALRPERVLFAHGLPFEGDATAELRRSLGWLLPAA